MLMKQWSKSQNNTPISMMMMSWWIVDMTNIRQSQWKKILRIPLLLLSNIDIQVVDIDDGQLRQRCLAIGIRRKKGSTANINLFWECTKEGSIHLHLLRCLLRFLLWWFLFFPQLLYCNSLSWQWSWGHTGVGQMLMMKIERWLSHSFCGDRFGGDSFEGWPWSRVYCMLYWRRVSNWGWRGTRGKRRMRNGRGTEMNRWSSAR